MSETMEFCEDCSETMEFCEDCIKGECSYHKWFTDLKLKDENEILLAELNHIVEYHIIDMIVEKVYKAESQLDYIESMYFIDFIHGNLEFSINMPTVAKKDDSYIPVTCHCGKDEVIDHQFEVSVSIMRHNPMSLTIRKNIFDDTILHNIELIDYHDCLHMESIGDYSKIVNLATDRLLNYIANLKELHKESNE